MAKYKLCPMCNTHNPPSVLECTECGNDLMGLRILDDSIVDDNTQAVIPNSEATAALVRVCDCGAVNEVSARKCSVCGEDISDVIPSEGRSHTSDYYLESIDGLCRLRLECPSIHIVGRENELAEYLSDKPFVSRLHATISVTTDGVFIENRSRANGTFLNNEKMNDEVVYKLCKDDEIGLGGFCSNNSRQSQAAYFVLGCE